MASTTATQAELCRLRRDIARIEGRLAEADRLVLDTARGDVSRMQRGEIREIPSDPGVSLRSMQATKDPPANAIWRRARERRGRLSLGVSALDAALGGGLPLATLHEIRARESRDGGAAAGFALGLLSRLAETGAGACVLWISEADGRRETGGLYAPGLAALGLDPSRVVEVAARSKDEALWAFEAALACRGLGAAVCELRGVSLGLTATRRCALRARDAGVTGLLLRLGSAAEPSAAELRFRLWPAPAGRIGNFSAGVGRMAWRVALEKNRGGRTGVFTLEWNAYERSFAERGEGRRADPQPFSAAPSNRPPHPAEGGEGFRRAS
jgi:protein ImuA